MAAGSIVVDLLLRTGSFETDTARAGKSLKKLQKDAEATGKAIGLAFTGAVVGLGYLVKSAIDSADHLNDLSQKTGIAADTLGGIGFAASKAGLDLDSVAAGAGKLNKSLAEASLGTGEAAEAFKALGINVKDASGNTKSADLIIGEIADKFQGYADGPQKAALALKLFGKAGADMIPLLNGGGQAIADQIAYFKKYSGVTVETTKAADEFNDKVGDLKLLTGAFGQTLARDLLGPLSALVDYLKQSKEEAGVFSTAIAGIRVAFETISVVGSDVAFVFTQIGKAMVAVADGAVRLAHLDFQGVKTVFSTYNQQARDARTSLDAFQARVLGLQDKIGGGRGLVNPAFAVPSKPQAPGSGAGGPDTAEAELKRKLDVLLRSIRLSADEQQNALAFSNRFLEGEYQDGVTSLANFFNDQKNIRAAALRSLLAEQDAIIKAEEDFAKRTTNPASRIDAEGKAEDARKRKTQLIVKASQDEQLALQQNARDVIALQKAYEGVSAQVLDLQENFTAAVAIKFDLQFDALKKTFSAEGNQAGLQAIETLKAAAIAQAAFQKASLDASRTLDALSNTEERIALAQQTGAFGSLEALVKVGEARRAQIPILEAQVAAEEAIAKASGNQTLIKNAEAARLALDKLKASADPLAESLNKTFGDDLTTAIEDFATGTKSAADAFKSFAKSVLNDILKLGSKSISESIFGGSGGAGGLISSLFSSGSAQGGASSAGGLISSFASLFSGFFADGGTIPPGQWGVVGERGPERAYGGTTGLTVQPGGGGTTNHINVQIQAAPGMSRDTAMQQGAAYGQGIQKALARNG